MIYVLAIARRYTFTPPLESMYTLYTFSITYYVAWTLFKVPFALKNVLKNARNIHNVTIL